MSRWTGKTFKLKKDHGWTTRPGNNLFAADRGALMFEYPSHWDIGPGDDDAMQFRDKPHPDDNATLAASVMYLKPHIEWQRVPLALMLKDMANNDKRKPFFVGDPTEIHRRHLDAAWIEIRFIDPNEKREAHGRMCVGFQANIQALITFDYWAADAEQMVPVWNTVLETLVIGDYIADPRKK